MTYGKMAQCTCNGVAHACAQKTQYGTCWRCDSKCLSCEDSEGTEEHRLCACKGWHGVRCKVEDETGSQMHRGGEAGIGSGFGQVDSQWTHVLRCLDKRWSRPCCGGVMRR